MQRRGRGGRGTHVTRAGLSEDTTRRGWVGQGVDRIGTVAAVAVLESWEWNVSARELECWMGATFRPSRPLWVLQLRQAEERRIVLPSARSPFPSASGGPPGLGCVGDPCLLVRRCTVGPSLSRFACPGDAGEAEAAAALWNKFLRSCPHFGGVISGAGERPVRAGSDGAGCLVAARFCPVVGGSDVGVGSPVLHPGTGLALVLLYRGMAYGMKDVWWVDWRLVLAVCRRWVLIHGRSSLGCVPGRCASLVFSCCGSRQSLCAMKLLQTLVYLLFVSVSGGHTSGGVRRWKRMESSRGIKGPLGVLIIFVWCRVLCASLGGQLSLLHPSSTCLYLCCLLYCHWLV